MWVMNFKGWRIEVGLDGYHVGSVADFDVIVSILKRSLEKLVFECEFMPRVGDFFYPYSSEELIGMDEDIYNGMVVQQILFSVSDKTIKFELE